jgi:hypothetical protein
MIAAGQHRIVATKIFLFFFTLLSNSLSLVKFLSFCDMSRLSVQFRNSVLFFAQIHTVDPTALSQLL